MLLLIFPSLQRQTWTPYLSNTSTKLGAGTGPADFCTPVHLDEVRLTSLYVLQLNILWCFLYSTRNTLAVSRNTGNKGTSFVRTHLHFNKEAQAWLSGAAAVDTSDTSQPDDNSDSMDYQSD